MFVELFKACPAFTEGQVHMVTATITAIVNAVDIMASIPTTVGKDWGFNTEKNACRFLQLNEAIAPIPGC